MTPIDPFTGASTGPTVPATASEEHHFFLTDNRAEASCDQQQSILVTPAQTLFVRLDAGHTDRVDFWPDCGPAAEP